MSRTYPSTIPTISFAKKSERKANECLFTLLEHKRSRGNYFLAGVAVHAMLLTFAIVLPLYLTGSLNVRRYLVTPLIAPPVHREVVELTEYKPEPLRIKPARTVTPIEPIVTPKPAEAPKEMKLPEVRFDSKPVPMAPAAPKLEVLAPPAPAAAPVPVPVVKTDVFSDPVKTIADVAPRKVAATGFGEADSTGASRASRSVVTGSGFSDTGVESGSGRKKSVQSIASGFDDVRAAEPQAKRREAEIARLPVEIVFKPRPDYTEEARRLRVQGDVVLRVLFAASGKIQVLDVVQGLGYGLDENARRAAEQIRFKPASNDGKPVDSTANVRIAFQLAY